MYLEYAYAEEDVTSLMLRKLVYNQCVACSLTVYMVKSEHHISTMYIMGSGYFPHVTHQTLFSHILVTSGGNYPGDIYYCSRKVVLEPKNPRI